jgi:uncharacterized protein YndB with AHSA1/START domain
MKTKRTALEAKAQIEIRKPVHRVFEAIVDPRKMSHYFISSGNRRMQDGKTVHWKFDTGGGIDAKVKHIERDRFVSFSWSASGADALVSINLEPTGNGSTLIRVSESDWPPNEKGTVRCLEQTKGWMHFLCCMKAYLEFGINLRESRRVG